MRYLTKAWYLASQKYPLNDGEQKRLEEISSACRAAEACEVLPGGLREKFCFHDAAVRGEYHGADYVLSLDASLSPVRSVVFRDASIKGETPPDGAVWLYEELYRHKSGRGYEAHILFEAMQGEVHKRLREADLFDLKIICSDIVFCGADDEFECAFGAKIE